MRVLYVFFLPALALACASSPAATHGTHGTVTTLSAASTADYERCPHKVPTEVCGDWCREHDVPESQCFECHPDLSFDPLPTLPPGADVVELSRQGEDVPTLEAHAVRGKVTLFDFYAVWCAPCRKIDGHVAALLAKRSDLAVRKLNVVSWETPLAARYLKAIPNLPYVVVYGRSGQKIRAISGLDLGALDEAIAEAGRP
jgi:thiol-disulfide isomerase/thioredoxin